ncbi:MAG: flavin monoamine oxidase family protein [Terriglobales bacterium]
MADSASQDRNVVIIGAGIAGLAAAAKLVQASIPVTILEARDRIGGRIFTHRDPATPVPIELGAEFIHGMAPEIIEPLKEMNAPIIEVEGDNWCFNHGQLEPCRFFAQVDKIMAQMDGKGPDESFLEFIERCFPNPKHDPDLEETKQHAIGYVAGFNAADPAEVGVHWLVRGMEAEERIQGQRAFRLLNGYAELVKFFGKRLQNSAAKIRTGAIVEQITWRPGHAKIRMHHAGSGSSIITARKVLITLPLGVLKTRAEETGAVRFTPALPRQKIDAMDRLEMGKVIRVVLRFHHRFWEALHASDSERKELGGMSFLFSDDEWFPTWWMTEPRHSPIITGWAPFRAGERLSGHNESFVVDRCLRSLGRLLQVTPAELQRELAAAHFHDWQSDPFSRGAYSYGKVGSDGAQQALAAPLENTLFFAGEATDVSGNNGTVHGAIASGQRAAEEILRGL